VGGKGCSGERRKKNSPIGGGGAFEANPLFVLGRKDVGEEGNMASR